MTMVGLSQNPPLEREEVRKITLENRQKEHIAYASVSYSISAFFLCIHKALFPELSLHFD